MEGPFLNPEGRGVRLSPERVAELEALAKRGQAERDVPELRAVLSLLIRTVWDTFAHSRVPSQWEALSETTRDAVKLLQRLEGRREACSAPKVPTWIRDEWRAYLREQKAAK